jgi:hypothetical protein
LQPQRFVEFRNCSGRQLRDAWPEARDVEI